MRFCIRFLRKFSISRRPALLPRIRWAMATLCGAQLLFWAACLSTDSQLYHLDRRDQRTPADSTQPGAAATSASKEGAPAHSSRNQDAKTSEDIAEPAAATPAANSYAARQNTRTLHANDPELRLVQESGRTYGVYRLKAGEALYSAVVVRFTGRVEAEDVNQIARDLMTLNGIQDETKIAIGTEIRVPLELLDEALFTAPVVPRAASRRSRYRHVILDAGHGGNDPGTIMHGMREDEIAFDLMKRMRAGLARHGLKVHTLVSTYQDAAKLTNGQAPREGRRHQYVNVTPAYSMEDSRIGLNLRIYLLDDIYSRLLREGAAPEDIIFISVHLDHLHPSVSGTMIYVPDAGERLSTFKATADVYTRFAESREQTISFNTQENLYAESASEAFAESLLGSLRRQHVPVHTYQPIRRYVYRGGGKWTPGIIRNSRVPTSVLIEAANLANRDDWQRIRSSEFRQRWANAVVQAIVARN